MARCVALIPAAGTGSRLTDDRPKQHLPLAGRPLLAWSVEALLSHPKIDFLYVVLAAADRWFDRFDWTAFGTRLRPLRLGGETRAQTVCNGLNAIGQDIDAQDWVLVHDAARPCLTTVLLDRLIDSVSGDEVGGLLAIRVADTLKRGDDGARVVATEPRVSLWQAQTPQMFRCALLQRALAAADLERITDESSAVERLGLKPLLVESSAENIKVTFPEDIRLAEAILKSR
jgi:2-C-methyl-D-erythritol 4-phosphate cytidylyltransferase